MTRWKPWLLSAGTIAAIAATSTIGWHIWQYQRQSQHLDRLQRLIETMDYAPRKTLSELESDRDRLKESLSVLESIPNSIKATNRSASSQLVSSRLRLSELEVQIDRERKVQVAIREAEALAQEAVALGKVPKPTPATWVKASRKWQEAIAILETTPNTKLSGAIVREKLDAYRSALAQIGDRTTKENRAREKLAKAREYAAEAARMTQDPPYDSDIWALAGSKWLDAIAELEDFPNGTSVTSEAKQTLQAYRKNLNAIQNEYAKQVKREVSLRQAAEFEEIFVGLESDTKESLRRAKNSGLSPGEFVSLCRRSITDNFTSMDFAGRGMNLNSYADGLCRYIWNRL